MALCHPDNVIWPDPSVLEPDPDFTPEELARFELQIDLALGYAWTSLQVLTAYQLAICPVTVRPTCPRCSGGSYFIAPVSGSAGAPFWPEQQNDGSFINVLCGCSGSGCDTRDVILPGTVGEILEVQVDGVTLDPETYRVDNGNHLVRQDGKGWPYCQNFRLPDGEPGTFSVTYYQGATTDILARYAAGLMADEWLKGIRGNDDCRLPQGTVNIIRQGLTIEVEKDMFENGLTGIGEVDAFTARYNPYRQKLPSAIFSLDNAPIRQTTWGA